jgi:hypothetical protein
LTAQSSKYLEKSNLFAPSLAATFKDSPQPEYDHDFKKKTEREVHKWLKDTKSNPKAITEQN